MWARVKHFGAHYCMHSKKSAIVSLHGRYQFIAVVSFRTEKRRQFRLIRSEVSCPQASDILDHLNLSEISVRSSLQLFLVSRTQAPEWHGTDEARRSSFANVSVRSEASTLGRKSVAAWNPFIFLNRLTKPSCRQSGGWPGTGLWEIDSLSPRLPGGRWRRKNAGSPALSANPE